MLLTSCAVEAAPEAVPPATELMPTAKEQRFSPREHLGGPSRPLQIDSVSFDYASLPEPSPRQLAEPLRIRLDLETQRISVNANAITRLTFGNLELFGSGRAEVPSTTVCRPELAMTGPMTIPRDPSGNAVATFEALLADEWSSTHVTYVRGTASIDTKECSAVVTSVMAVSAHAVIPDLLYGFRRCVANCAAADRSDEIWFIGPPSTWTATSGDLNPEKKAKTGAFTLAQVPLRPASSASFLLHADWNQVAFFVAARSSAAPLEARDVRVYGQRIELTAEVVWPSAAAAPEATAYVSGLTPNAREMLKAAALPR